MEIVKDDEYGNKYYIKDGELYKFEGDSNKLIVPSEVRIIKSRLFSITLIEEMHISNNVIEFSNGAFLKSFTIKNLYFDGDVSSFNKINFSYFGGRRPLTESITHIFVKDINDKYFEMVNGDTKLVETRGLSIKFINDILSRNNDLIKKSCKEMMKNNPDGFITYFRYYQNQPKLIIEYKYSSLEQDIKDLLIKEKISFISDDLIINYGVNKDTKINLMRSNLKMKPIKPTYGNNVIDGDTFKGFNVDLTHFDTWDKELPVSVKIDISKDIKKIAFNAFKDIRLLYIRYDGLVKDWLNIDIDENLYKHFALIFCEDGVIQYETINHEKSESKDLYYGYAWLANQYLYELQFFIRRKDIWGFLSSSEKAIISSHYFVSANYIVFYDEDDDLSKAPKEYSILDFHNFKCISICDVEAG